MFDQLLTKTNQLAGFEYPAVDQSLNHFLSISFCDSTEQLELVGAVESDQATVAFFLSNSLSASLTQFYQQHWQRALLQANLAEANVVNAGCRGVILRTKLVSRQDSFWVQTPR
jgi:hypothetical protein|tara:strand:+ start:1301 stop:1642 length:342 start_codon:yes stop_codon:yes gene_type:complete